MTGTLKMLTKDLIELINMSISEDTYSIIDAELSDAVLAQYGNNESSKFLGEKRITKEQYIFFLLGHIPINPSREGNIDLLNKIYIYMEPNGKATEKYPNWNSNSSQKFIDELIENSKAEANERKFAKHGYGPRDRKLFILHGPRGIGKTFFLNHIFSRYNSYLDSKKCIWVRINLIDSFGGSNPDIKEWLLSKLSLVVYRYFNKNSHIPNIHVPDDKHIEIHEDLVKYIDKVKIKELRELLLLKVSMMDLNFRKEKILSLSRGDVPIELCLELSRILINRNYSFLFIIDGLDRLDLSPRFKDRFDNAIHGLNRLINTDTTLGATYLLVCRSESLQEVKNRVVQIRTRGSNIVCEIKEVAAAPFETILKERIRFIKKKVEILGKTNDWNLRNWPKHLCDYEQYVLDENNVRNFEEYSKRMIAIFLNNRRAKVQLCQLTYIDYLRQKKYDKQYEIIERMCKGGRMFPIAPLYSVDKSGIIIYSSERLYDNIFLPNIFNFPFSHGFYLESPGTAKTFLLTGLRIIQFILAAKIINEKLSIKYINCGFIGNLLQELFGYNPVIIYNLMLMYSDYELIEMNGIPFTHNDIANYNLIPMPKLDYIFNLLNNVAYLNMCSMRAPMNLKWLKEKRFIMASCLSLDSTDKWSSIKINNTLNLVRILHQIDQKEGELIEAAISRGKINPEYFEILEIAKKEYRLFQLFTGNDLDSILRQLKAILYKINNKLDIENFVIKSWNI